MKLAPLIFLCLFKSAFASNLKDLNALKSPFSLAPLPYDAKSLAPAIDEATMILHHGKHHQSYVDKLNDAYQGGKNLLDLFKKINRESAEVRNNAGGHWNHAFFWSILSGKKEDHSIPENIKNEIIKTFGSFEEFQAVFEKAGLSRFGSGWAWLIRTKQGKLKVTSTANQDNPLMNTEKLRGWPLLGADVWEHAYYLKYQNKREEYLKNFWSVINWRQVQEYNEEAKKLKSL
jgi:superoxide dismutase, Fe-Mn family